MILKIAIVIIVTVKMVVATAKMYTSHYTYIFIFKYPICIQINQKSSYHLQYIVDLSVEKNHEAMDLALHPK